MVFGDVLVILTVVVLMFALAGAMELLQNKREIKDDTFNQYDI